MHRFREQTTGRGKQSGKTLWTVFRRNVGFICICAAFVLAAGCTKVAVLPESGETLSNWTLARDYQAQGRYELARQYYLLALAGARTPESQQTLQRELNSVDRMIEAMR